MQVKTIMTFKDHPDKHVKLKFLYLPTVPDRLELRLYQDFLEHPEMNISY